MNDADLYSFQFTDENGLGDATSDPVLNAICFPSGLHAVQKIRRGPVNDNGILRDDMVSSRIRSIRLGSDIEAEERLSALVMDTNSPGFAELLRDRRERKQRFFHQRPPQVLDVCQVPMAGRVTR